MPWGALVQDWGRHCFLEEGTTWAPAGLGCALSLSQILQFSLKYMKYQPVILGKKIMYFFFLFVMF